MKWLKRKAVAAWMAAASLFGYQVYREPVYEDHTPIEVVASPTPSPSATPNIIPIPGEHPSIVLDKIMGASASEKALIEKAVIADNLILKDPCFKDGVLGGKFTETKGLTNAEIFALLSKAPTKIKIEIFNGSYMQNYVWKTVGYDIGDGVVYMNRFYFGSVKRALSLTNHEGLGHGYKFHHDNVKATSFPYKLNDISEDCYDSLEIGKQMNGEK